MLEELVVKFLNVLSLNKRMSELGVTEEQLAKMEGHFLLGVLPFAPKEELAAMITQSY